MTDAPQPGREPSTSRIDADDDAVPVIDPAKVFFFITKAREFQVKEAADFAGDEADGEGSNPSDEGQADVLIDRPDDSSLREMQGLIAALNEDEIATLIALAWVGRGDFDAEDWPEALAAAQDQARDKPARYLTRFPLVADLIEDAMAEYGEDFSDFEKQRL